MCVGKGYVSNGLFKLNVMAIINKNNQSSVYLLESSNLWHGRLEHVSYETKLTRSSFQTIERNTKPLELIHNDVCDLKFIQTRGGNKYFITFIDNNRKYCYVYLLKSKDGSSSSKRTYETMN